MKQILLVLVGVAVIGSSLAGASPTNESPVKTSPWERSEIVDHTFELITTNQVEVFIFKTNGTVTATVGTQDALAGPVLAWLVTSNGILIVKDDSMQVTLQKVSFKTNIVEALRNGKPATYKVMKTE